MLHKIKEKQENRQLQQFVDIWQKQTCELYYHRFFRRGHAFVSACWLEGQGFPAFHEACVELGALTVLSFASQLLIITRPDERPNMMREWGKVVRAIKYCEIRRSVRCEEAIFSMGPVVVEQDGKIRMVEATRDGGGWYIWHDHVVGEKAETVVRVIAELDKQAIQFDEVGRGSWREKEQRGQMENCVGWRVAREKVLAG